MQVPDFEAVKLEIFMPEIYDEPLINVIPLLNQLFEGATAVSNQSPC